MNERLKHILTTCLLCIVIFMAFHFYISPYFSGLVHKWTPRYYGHFDTLQWYLLYWVQGIVIGKIWLKEKKNFYFLIYFPPLFLIGYGLFLKGIEIIFGYGDLHKTLRQALSLFRSFGFIIIYFTFLNIKKRLFSLSN